MHTSFTGRSSPCGEWQTPELSKDCRLDFAPLFGSDLYFYFDLGCNTPCWWYPRYDLCRQPAQLLALWLVAGWLLLLLPSAASGPLEWPLPLILTVLSLVSTSVVKLEFNSPLFIFFPHICRLLHHLISFQIQPKTCRWPRIRPRRSWSWP